MRFLYCTMMMLFVVCLNFSGCPRDSPEARVRATVSEVQRAAEKKDLQAVLLHIAKTYRDEQGNDRETLKGMLYYLFLQHPKISIVITDLDVTVNDRSANARFQAVLAGRAGETEVLPEALDAYRFEVALSEDAGKWMVSSAKWSRLVERQ